MTTITTNPAALDEILDRAAYLLDSGNYAGAPLLRQTIFALTDAFNGSGLHGEVLQDAKNIVSDLLWNEAGQRNLFTYCASTHDRRKIVRLLRRTARKNRS